ncbi:MAG: chemotaxis protein CheA [Ignavibacteria bacterium]|nr:chemotaxis protein CheA [Ignavibacteria bacterium]
MEIDQEMQEIFESYIVESTELLDLLSQDLMLIEENPKDEELLNRIFRTFHTLKGTSSFMGFEKIATLTHSAEEILNRLRKFELELNQDIVDVLLEVQDVLTLMLGKVRGGEDLTQIDLKDILNKIEVLKVGGRLDTEKEVQQEQGEIRTEEKHSSVEAVLQMANELISKKGDFTPEEYSFIESAFAEQNRQLMSKVKLDFDVEKIFSSKEDSSAEEVISKTDEPEHSKGSELQEEKNIEGEAKTKVSSKTAAPSALATESIRVDVSRVEHLMDLSGELVLGRNRLEQVVEKFLAGDITKTKLKELEETASQLDFITSEIQASVMRMRMVPIGKLFQKAPRIVRDLAKQFNKKIQLIMDGEETEIDKGIIEELSDPLVHMLRNACDHGIEPPEERIKLGKPEVGTVYLGALQEGNNIVIRVSDDGRGLNPEKIKEKALQRGLISQEEALQLSNRQVFQLIFYPGFSTAQSVSSVSGRGVGMDVVRTNILKLKGMIDIDSEIGMGTTFTIKLPLTLAIIQGLLVRVKSEIYAIPLSSVLEVVSCDVSMVTTINKREVIRIRSDILPLFRLNNVLNVDGEEETLENKYIVVVGVGEFRVGLVVDELLGQQEIVIKPLGNFLGHIEGIAGVTILGDGSVVVILDVGALVYTRN